MVVTLRDVRQSDLPTFFMYEKDPVANHMAAFTAQDPSDWIAFQEHWAGVLADDANLTQCITIDGGAVVGHIATFMMFGVREVSYWIDRAHWNRGIATAALSQFLARIPTRPLYARAAKDNIASRRVLEKCCFAITGEGSGFAHGRKAETDEYIFTLA